MARAHEGAGSDGFRRHWASAAATDARGDDLNQDDDDDAATEMLEPYRGHRFRVQQLLAMIGGRRPRRAPRMTLPTHTPYATRGRS